MSNVNKALETQIKNIEAKTGKSLAELAKYIMGSSLSKHGELRDMVKEDFGLGYGDANTLVHLAKKMSAIRQWMLSSKLSHSLKNLPVESFHIWHNTKTEKKLYQSFIDLEFLCIGKNHYCLCLIVIYKTVKRISVPDSPLEACLCFHYAHSGSSEHFILWTEGTTKTVSNFNTVFIYQKEG